MESRAENGRIERSRIHSLDEPGQIPEELQPQANELFSKLAGLAKKAERRFGTAHTFEGSTYILDNGTKNIGILWVPLRYPKERFEELRLGLEGLFEDSGLAPDFIESYDLLLILNKNSKKISMGIDCRETDEHYEEADQQTFELELGAEKEMRELGLLDSEDLSVAEGGYVSLERNEGRLSFVPSRDFLEKTLSIVSAPGIGITTSSL